MRKALKAMTLAAIAAAVAAGLPGNAWSQQPPRNIYQELVTREPQVAQADHRIYYGTNLQHFGDLRLPKTPGPHPVAIVIHGGAWGSGVSLHYMSPLAAALTCSGVATWNIEYRRLGSGGEWPNLFKDVAAASDFVRELAPKYQLDLNRVVVTGHSAGGHLSLWLATRDRLPASAALYSAKPIALKGVVALGAGGTGDLVHFKEAMPRFSGAIVDLVGGETRDRTALGSPATHLPLGTPQVLINGDSDPSVPLKTVEHYAALARSKGDTVTIVPIANGEHFVSADPSDRVAGPAIRDAILSQLGMDPRRTDSCFGPGR